MDDSELRKEAVTFFDEFVNAFHTFDGSEIARRYRAPYVALHADGSIDCFTTDEGIASYFQTIVDEYHRDGCRSCRYKDLDAVAVGAQCVLGTVTWELTGDNGDVLSAWRESYNLACSAEGLRIFASVDH